MPAQIITSDDLREFKFELIDEIKKLLRQSGVQPTKKWLKTSEVRKLLNVSPNTLQNMRITGNLTYSKIGGVMYYDYDDIQKMLVENKRKSA
jgi:hypothetical protein